MIDLDELKSTAMLCLHAKGNGPMSIYGEPILALIDRVRELEDALESKTAKADVCHGILLKVTEQRDDLKQALLPFSKLADYWLEQADIHDLDDQDTCATEIEFGHLRTAARAIGEVKDG